MTAQLDATVLVENTPVPGLRCEHGLSVHLRYVRDERVTHVLLDFGQSDAFARNASELGVDLAAVDFAVLSHAHYDHADGMEAFFAANSHAPVYLSAACAENCYSTKGGTAAPAYIGIKQGVLARFSSRLVRTASEHASAIAPGVHLVPHTTAGLDAIGQHAGMLVLDGSTWRADDFAHELSLAFELDDDRLVVFNSCSHAGLATIASEVAAAFPGRRISAYVGGLHLMRSGDEDILRTADAVRSAGIEHLYTGHCTGEHAFDLLQRALPGQVRALRPGLSFVL